MPGSTVSLLSPVLSLHVRSDSGRGKRTARMRKFQIYKKSAFTILHERRTSQKSRVRTPLQLSFPALLQRSIAFMAMRIEQSELAAAVRALAPGGTAIAAFDSKGCDSNFYLFGCFQGG